MTGTEQKPSPRSEAALDRILEDAQKGLSKNEAVTSALAACQGFSIAVIDITPNGYVIQGFGQEECQSAAAKIDCDAAKHMSPEQRGSINSSNQAEAKAFVNTHPGAASFIKSVEEACHIETPPACSAKDKLTGACLTQ